MPLNFLNVDLEIDSKSGLAPLAAAIEKDLCVLYSGKFASRHRLNLESHRFQIHGDKRRRPENIIGNLCSVIERLAPAERRLWDSARKVFDLGFDLVAGERVSCFTIEPQSILRIAELGGAVAATFYRYDERDTPGGSSPASRPELANARLAVDSRSNLDYLATSADARRLVIRNKAKVNRRYHLLLESNLSSTRAAKRPDADTLARDLCLLIERPPAEDKRRYAAARKVFDLEYSMSPGARVSALSLPPKNVLRLARLGASLAINFVRGDIDAQKLAAPGVP
jgi:hypothetical protein